jgi:hypothetical protein
LTILTTRHVIWAAAFSVLAAWASVGAGSAPQPAAQATATSEDCGCKSGIRAKQLRELKEGARAHVE